MARSKKASYAVNGRPSSLPSLRVVAQDDSLKPTLGDYLSAKEVVARTDIDYATLQRWRRSGRLRSHKVGGFWFYSRQDLLDLINSSER